MPINPSRKVAKTEDLYQYCSSYNSINEQKLRCFGYLPYAWKEWGKKPMEILKLCSAPQVDVLGCGRALSRLYLPGFRNKGDLTFFDIYNSASPQLQEPMARFGGIGIVEYLPSKGREYCRLLKKPEEACINQLKDTGRSMDIDVP